MNDERAGGDSVAQLGTPVPQRASRLLGKLAGRRWLERRGRPIRLVCTEEGLRQLRQGLLPPDDPRGLEHARIAFLGRGRAGKALELYLHTVLPTAEYTAQGPARAELSPRCILETFHQFAESGLPVYLHAHSHPFTDKASFSATDDRYLGRGWRSLKNFLWNTGRQRDLLYVRLVYGREEAGFTAEVTDGRGHILGRVSEVKLVGPSGIRFIPSFRDKGHEAAPAAANLFDRNIRFLGEEAQRRLHGLRLAVCGAGGVGSQVVAQALGLGFRHIAVIDPDRVEASNLNRLVGARRADVGRPKVKVLARQVRRFDPTVRVRPVVARVQEERARRAIVAADIIVAAVDSDAARLHLQILAARHLKPLLDLGSGIIGDPRSGALRAMGGQARLYVPGGPCLLCQGLNPDADDEIDRRLRRAVGYVSGLAVQEAPPSAVTVNAVTVGLGMDLLLRYLTGFAGAPHYVRYDLLGYGFRALPFTRRPDCPICGEEGVEAMGDEEAVALSPSTGTELLFPQPGEA